MIVDLYRHVGRPCVYKKRSRENRPRVLKEGGR